MSRITRRQVLSASAASPAFMNPQSAQAQSRKRPSGGPGRAPFWEPGPNKNLKRDLKPGPTPIRIANPLNVGRSRGAQPPPSISAAVKALRDQGYRCAWITGPQPWESASEAMVSELQAALKEYDVDMWEVGAYRNILHPDESARQANLKYVAHCVEVAEKIGCRMASTITGSRNPEGNRWADNYAVHPDNWTLETWKLTISGIKQILKDTAGLKATLGIEAQCTTNIDGPVAHRNLIEDVADPRMKVSLDPTNMVQFSNHFHTTELLNQCFDLLGEDIYGCAAKDSHVLPHSQTVLVQEVCPGRGSLDYETYLVRMSHMKWARSLNLEHFPTDQNPEACAYIRKIAAKVGVTILGS